MLKSIENIERPVEMRLAEEPAPERANLRRVKDQPYAGPTLLKRFRSLVWWMLLAVIVVLASTWYWSEQHPVLYTSTVKFLLLDHGPSEGQIADNDPNGAQVMRVLYLVRSTESFDGLIDKFDLINARKALAEAPSYSRTTLYQQLEERISVNSKEGGLVEVSVQDEDQERALHMADAIFEWLAVHLQEVIKREVERKLELYSELISRTDRSVSERSRTLLATARELGNIAERIPSDHPSDDPLQLLNMELTTIASQMTLATHDLQKMQEQYESSLVLVDRDPLPSVRIMNKAHLDIATSPHLALRSRAIFWSLITVAFMILATVTWHVNQREFKESFRELNLPGGSRSGE